MNTKEGIVPKRWCSLDMVVKSIAKEVRVWKVRNIKT